MSRRGKVRSGACYSLLLASILLLPPGAPAQASGPPNVVVFLVDDLGYMDVEANNPECFYETPHINQLAESGVRFTDGYAASPVCSPSRYSLMTGKYPTRVKATNFFTGRRKGRFAPAPLTDRMEIEEITLAETMPDKVADLRARLHCWYQEVNAEFLQEHQQSGKPWHP